MHDMPRTITNTTSSVLRLLVVCHRCGVCVRTKSVMIARKSDIFQRKQQYHPPYNRPITQSRRKVKSLCKVFPQALRKGFSTCSRKRRNISEDLPLSYSSPLPSDLNLSSEPHASDERVDLPEDLPLSGEEQGDIDAKPAPLPLKRHEDLPEGVYGEASALGAASPTEADMKDRERAIETRSGRKDVLLIETLRQARDKVSMWWWFRPAHAAALPPTLELCVRDASSEQVRDLLAITFISEEDRRDLGVARVVRGFVVQRPIAAALAVAGGCWRSGGPRHGEDRRSFLEEGDHTTCQQALGL